MTSVAEVRLWGNTIGAVSLAGGEDTASFEYDPAFTGSGIEISPLVMPVSDRVYRFPESACETFRGLPGMLADSLPDGFGRALVDAWLAGQGRTPESFNAIERLCYTGERGMGALEYAPATGLEASEAAQVQVDELVSLAQEILSQRERFGTSLHGDKAMLDIIRVGTSAGGQRPKAVIAWNPETNEVRSGQVKTDQEFEYWIMKFDGVPGNRDDEPENLGGFGALEYAYSKMAQDAGITMSDCRLFEENNRRHFMTRRFDRTSNGEKLHMQSLCGLAHFDYKMAGAYSYEQVFMVMRQLGLPMRDIEEQYRRMVFNVIARNQDDHVKNIAFLMNKAGEWRLSPAFDLTWSFNPKGAWTARHQMTVNNKRDNFTPDDLNACAKVASMVRGRARTIIDDVRLGVSGWNSHAVETGVDIKLRDQVRNSLRLKDF